MELKDFDPKQYTIHIAEERIEGTNYIVGRVKELPDITVYEVGNRKEMEVEIKGEIYSIIEELYKLARIHNRAFPSPLLAQHA